jgi:hypothetical protein
MSKTEVNWMAAFCGARRKKQKSQKNEKKFWTKIWTKIWTFFWTFFLLKKKPLI